MDHTQARTKKEKENIRLKLRKTRYIATAATLAAGLILGGRTQAQSTLFETNGTHRPGPGQALVIPPSQTIIALSPETTLFQFKIVKRDDNGFTHTDTSTYAGTTLLAEKVYFLRPNRVHGAFSSATVGAWYWYHNSKIDRLALYGKYFLDNRFGFQLNIGGDSHLGLFEYYLFALANIKNNTPQSPVGVQIGIGPYINRRSGKDETFSGGDPGIAALLGVGYAPKNSPLSYSAELRYINYHVPAKDLGVSTTDSLLRFYAGVNYKL